MINPEAMSDTAWYRWFTDPATPTEADVAAWEGDRLSKLTAQQQAERVKAWYAAHPEATCPPHIAILLATLEDEFGGNVCPTTAPGPLRT